MPLGATAEPVRTNSLQVCLCLPLPILSFHRESVFFFFPPLSPPAICVEIVKKHFRQKPCTEEINKALSVKPSSEILLSLNGSSLGDLNSLSPVLQQSQALSCKKRPAVLEGCWM